MKNTALLLLALASPVCAQTVTYNSFNFSSGQPITTLREMASNGTNDKALTVALTEPGFPQWSRDGKTLALTAIDPARPNKVSRDVFLVDGTTGAVRNLTKIEDQVDDKGSHTFFPVGKVFSNDGKKIAISFLHRTIATNQSITTQPLIVLYDASGLEPPVSISVTLNQEGNTMHGAGCDWSSTNLIAWPGAVSAPYTVNGVNYAPVTSTGIYILQPTASSSARALTRPRVAAVAAGIGIDVTKGAEVDYAPTFSPNGGVVAYVRVYRVIHIVGTVQTTLPDTCSIRLVNIDGLNDREVLRLPEGQWISKLSWSPDGAQILYDRGPQIVVNGEPISQANPQNVEIHTLNTSTLATARVHAAPAILPAWRPAVTTPPVATLPQVGLRLVPGGNNIEITWPVNAGTFQLQSSATPGGTFTNVTTAPVASGGVNKVTLARTAPKMFYRLKGQQ